ncbi:hypothetical protein [Lactobacillus taiwanensis]|uniref:hypothetical protein n=1 Tax=Lactobacillus taiwanensis TaxID=508451 RepID=UPI0021C41F56|nr:hypothetical protein [Lactobacillus taiwanensis]
MAVSAFAFIGLKMSGPDMRNTVQTYYQNVNLADLTIGSNYGLDKKDVKTIRMVRQLSYQLVKFVKCIWTLCFDEFRCL